MFAKYLVIAVIIMGAIIIGGLAYLYAERKGHNKKEWFLKGTAIGLILLAIAAVILKKFRKI